MTIKLQLFNCNKQEQKKVEHIINSLKTLELTNFFYNFIFNMDKTIDISNFYLFIIC